MKLSSADIYRTYKPSGCELRLYLYHHGIPTAEPGPFEEVIRKLGERYEKAYLATLGNVTDLSAGTPAERHRQTLQAISSAVAVIYQPLFMASTRQNLRNSRNLGAVKPRRLAKLHLISCALPVQCRRRRIFQLHRQ